MSVFDPRHRNHNPGAQITIALYRIGQALNRLMRAKGNRRHLSPTQIQSLLFLRFARPGIRTIGGLSERLGATYATTSGVVDAVERKGWVERQPLPEDHRVITLKLTQAGLQETEAMEDMLDEIEAAINDLSEADQQAVNRAAQAIVRRLQRRGHIQVYEMCWNCQFFQHNAHPNNPDGSHHCAFMDAPLPEPNTYLECPDFVEVESQ